MAWIYRMSRNERYPDPAHEIRVLVEVAEHGEQAFVLLSGRDHPPLSGRDVRRGDPIFFSIAGPGANGNGLVVHARGRIGALHHGSTPASVEGIYGELHDRFFREVVDLELILPVPITAREVGLSAEAEATLLAGQAHAAIFTPIGGDAPLLASVRDRGSPLRRVYDGLTEAEIDEIEALTLSRSRG